MASIGSLAQSVATSTTNQQHQASGPFNSLRSGAAFISYILKDVLGLDPVLIVNASLLFAAVSAFSRWISNTLYRQAKDWIVSSVTIQDDDPLYNIVLRWMADHKLPAQGSRAAKVVTVKTSTLEDDENALHLLEKSATKDKNQLMNYRAMIGRSPIEFQFEKVSHLFRHRGRFFWFRHNRHDRTSTRRSNDPYNNGLQHDICSLSFECFGRTADPIKDLILDAQTYELTKPQTTIRICRAITNPNMYLTRPARGIDTVILARDKKEALLNDINEYLHPRTRRWYTSHGIPYRRGYLFSGSPGTGKTSLTASLAGLFGLDLYTMSLLDPHVNENSLTNFFFNLQTRCIVLLEDIDAAGLKRDDDEDVSSYMSYQMMDPRMRRRRAPTPVSLSALLNALDGVASQEGRIVVMTTNHPEKLDEALIRPGRVDMHVKFDLPARPEMADLFLSMYKNLTSTEQIAGGKEHRVTSQDELNKLAETFAAGLPECHLSLAAIQGFLLKFKNEPEDAVANAEEWGRQAIEEKQKSEQREKKKAQEDARRLDLARVQAKIERKKAEQTAKEELAKMEESEATALKDTKAQSEAGPRGQQNSDSTGQNSEMQQEREGSLSFSAQGPDNKVEKEQQPGKGETETAPTDPAPPGVDAHTATSAGP